MKMKRLERERERGVVEKWRVKRNDNRIEEKKRECEFIYMWSEKGIELINCVENGKVMMREVWVGGTGKRTWQVQLVRESNVERENFI